MFFLIFVLDAPDSRASHPVDVVSVAIKAIEDFERSSLDYLKAFEGAGGASILIKRYRDRTMETLSLIKEVRWSEGPGPRRFRRVLRIVDLYTADQIEMIEDFGRGSGFAGSPLFDEVMDGLARAREKALGELKKAFRLEVVEEKRIRPVPLIDRSPFEEDKQGGKGIWDR